MKDVLLVPVASCRLAFPLSVGVEDALDAVLLSDDKSESRRSRRAWMMGSAPLDLVM